MIRQGFDNDTDFFYKSSMTDYGKVEIKKVNQPIFKALSDQNILVFDTGLGVEHAARMKRDGHDVRYFTFWSGQESPHFNTYAPGMGITSKSKYFFNDADKWADVLMFPDVGMGDIVDHYKRLGKPVWGSGRAQELELDRVKSLEIMNKLKIKYPKSKIIKGFENLTEHLKSTENVFVKFNIFRGDTETICMKEYNEELRLKLSKLELGFGPFADDVTFTIQDPVEGIEPGFDMIFDGNNFCKPYLYGYEMKDYGVYIGKLNNNLPPILADTANKIKSYLKETDYRGAISTECIIDKDNNSHLIDWTCRFPYPLSVLYTELYNNYSDVIINVANKKSVKINADYEYSVILELESRNALEDWTPLTFDNKFKNRIKVMIGSRKNGLYWAVPGHGYTTVLVVIGFGDTIDKAIDDVKNTLENADISAPKLNMNSTDNFNLVKEKIEEGKDFGVDF